MTTQCKMCGGSTEITEGIRVYECEYCGSMQTVPNADSEKKINLFNRANRLRMSCEFDKAAAVYEQIAAEFPNEAEGYWGLCLCSYGIQYVDDPATGKKMPTCHRTLPASILDDANFEQVSDKADPIAREVYREEAKEIDRIQKSILSIAANEAPYDVFICYKETDEYGNRTEDSVLSQEIYDALTEKGLKVFFSRITLEDKLGVQYEPYIYAALSSARVMLSVGTRFEYYDAVWVKNEWSRFLHMMKEDKQKTLIPCFKDLDAYDMPKEFVGLQAQDMNKLGWLQDLTRGVLKLCGNEPAMPAADQSMVREVIRETVRSSNADNLMKRVYIFLEDGDNMHASEYINKVLDIDVEYAPAYVAKVVLAHKLKREEDLLRLRKSIDHEKDWQKALRFADAPQKQKYERIARTIREQEDADRKQEQYKRASAYMALEHYTEALLEFHTLEDYKDSRENLQKCMTELRGLLLAKSTIAPERELMAARNRIPLVSRRLQQDQLSFDEAEARREAVEKRRQELLQDIYSLNGAVSRMHGLFTGGKKRSLRENIDLLNQQLAEVDQKYRELEAVSEKAKETLRSRETALAESRERLSRAEEDVRKPARMAISDEAVIAAARDIVKRGAALQPGMHLSYGCYPQTAEGADNTPIEWVVLERREESILVVSRRALDVQPYHERLESVAWETCTLRGWLNDAFLNRAFTTAEQSGILMTNVDNGRGTYDTDDRVFLLSPMEASKYFGWAKHTTACRIAPTAYAIARGAEISNECKTSDGNAAGMWWLRTPGANQSSASLVPFEGTGILNVNYDRITVRPAMKLDLRRVLAYL